MRTDCNPRDNNGHSGGQDGGMIVPGKWLKNVIGNVLRCARIDFVATEGIAPVKNCSTIYPPVLCDTHHLIVCVQRELSI